MRVANGRTIGDSLLMQHGFDGIASLERWNSSDTNRTIG